MSVNLIVNGITYAYPQTGDQTWGDAATNWASAVTSGMLQKAGGIFTLTSEVDFGATYGLKLAYMKSRTANAAAAGVVRLAKTDSINFRNNANSADLTISIDGSDNLVYNGTKVIISGLIVNADVAAGAAIAYSKLNLANSILNADINSAAAIAYSKLNLSNSILNSDINASAAIAYSKLALSNSIIDADINSAAAISRSKLASGPANHVIINDGSGVFSSEARLGTSRGGTNLSSYATGDLLYASTSSVLSKRGIGSSGQILTVSGGLPVWSSATNTLSVVTKTANYTILSSDDVVLGNADASSSFTLTLPSAASNAGKAYKISKRGSDFTKTVTVAAAGGDVIDGSASFVLYTLGDEIDIVSDGISAWIVLEHSTNTAPTAYSLVPKGTTSDPSIGTTDVNTAYWHRNGSEIIINYNLVQSAPGFNGSGSYFFPVPSGIVLDTNVIPSSTTNNRGACGSGYVSDNVNASSADTRPAFVSLYSNTAFWIWVPGVSGSTLLKQQNAVGSTEFNLGSVGYIIYSVQLRVPVAGWKP